MENKQTVVEWLVRILYSPVCVGFIQGRRQIPHDIIKRAKQMEKEHIMMAYIEGRINQGLKQNKSSEQYYNETYGK